MMEENGHFDGVRYWNHVDMNTCYDSIVNHDDNDKIFFKKERNTLWITVHDGTHIGHGGAYLSSRSACGPPCTGVMTVEE